MSKIERVFIVDDEPLARVSLRRLVEKYTNWHVALELETAHDLESHVSRLQPDLIFLDVRMPRRGGMPAAADILAGDSAPLLVFVTAYSEHAVQAFELGALDYLLKPFSDERFVQTVDRVNNVVGNMALLKQAAAQQAPPGRRGYLKVLVIRSVGMIRIIDMKDVVWFRGSGNYVEVMLAKEQHLHRISIGFLEENLDPAEFVRSHRSAIVRLSAIREIKTLDDGQFSLGLENGDSAKLSSTYRDSILDRIESRG